MEWCRYTEDGAPRADVAGSRGTRAARGHCSGVLVAVVAEADEAAEAEEEEEEEMAVAVVVVVVVVVVEDECER